MRTLIFIGLVMNAQAQMETTLEWSFLHPKSQKWLELGSHGSVQEALIDSGEMPDPFYGENEEQFGWMEDHVWEFRSIFFPSQDVTQHRYIELEFPSIDTYAKVYLNDSLILETDNAFIPHRVFIQDALKPGLNEINVFITPPVIHHKNRYKEMGYELPAPNDVHETAIAPLSRKPQYQFGWDWALRMNTIGFHKPVRVYAYDHNRIIGTSINTVRIQDGHALLRGHVSLARIDSGKYILNSARFGQHEMLFHEGHGEVELRLDNPLLWWPKGQGEAHLYEEEWSLNTVEDRRPIDRKAFRFGVKTSELINEKDEWGTSYYFKINGRRIFAKGANYIPQEIFPARVTETSVKKMVNNMAAANFNMIRVWGGGYYPDDVFFEACDEQGIMVWQDLMFACAMYPGDDEFISNIHNEFHYQVPRIAGHASVVQFNGNNEVEVAWGNWGFQIKYGLYGKNALEIEAAYDRIFKETAPNVINRYTSIPYIHTSPLSNWGKMQFYNHGSQHYWGVWHGKDPIEDFGKKIGRFNAEYGFQSFPEYSTLNTFSEEKDWELNSNVMKHHQKSYVGNNMIMKHAKRLYGEPENFTEFVYYSQLTQSMAVSMAISGHRIDAPRCGGTLVWQLNDCWPAPTWSSIDYEGNWKALHYQMKKDYREVAIVAKYNDLEDIEYHVVSNLVDTFECRIQCEFFDLDGNRLGIAHLSENLNGQESRKLCLKGWEDRLENDNVHLVFTHWDVAGNQYVSSFNRIHKTVPELTEDDVRLSFEKTSDTTGKLTVRNNAFARNLWVYCMKPGVQFSQNFESLLPGEHDISISFDGNVSQEDFKMIWLNNPE